MEEKLLLIKKIQKEIDCFLDKPKFVFYKKKFIKEKTFINFVNLIDIFRKNINTFIKNNTNLRNIKLKFSMQDENALPIFENYLNIHQNGSITNNWDFFDENYKKILFFNYTSGLNSQLLNEDMYNLVYEKLKTKSKKWSLIETSKNKFFSVRYTPQTISFGFL